jgi:methylenetetrahydrofolate/methylenetetrahydromethanopterin dehydrogenase (NADP+)
MEKLLFHFDSDDYASSFDAVAAYDGGADHVIQYAKAQIEGIAPLIDGVIFTRPPKQKQYSAIFISGSDMVKGEAIFKGVKQKFFSNFRVSIMLDSNGCNTTAAAGVARITQAMAIAGKKAVVLAGTGPVGQRAAAMLALEGAHVTVTSRQMQRAEQVCRHLEELYKVKTVPFEVKDKATTVSSLAGAQIVFAAGKMGIQLMEEDDWRENASIEIMADVNTTPPLGIQGIEMTDKGENRDGKIIFGGLGIGNLKLRIHRACIGKLFERNDLVLDAQEILAIAKQMVTEA